MADTIVNLVLNKLADAVVREALFQYGVGDKVEQAQRELRWIQAFLKDADSKRHKDERVKCWVNEVKEVGYLIEDTLDEFLMIEFGGRNTLIKRIVKLPIKLIAKHKLGTALDKIQQRLGEISAKTTKYGIEGLNDSTTIASDHDLPARPLMIPNINTTEVIGFEVDKKTIIDQLIDANVPRRSVVSIVGAGGSGKTTLAKEVYTRDEIKCHFALRIWSTISQEFKLIDIVIKMLKEFREVSSTEIRDEERLIIELHNSMKEKKYLVVLDDVWSTDLWTQLKDVLPDTANGSRVLITTRFKNIAEGADSISTPHEIRTLNEQESQQLLLKTIFPNKFANECPENLLPIVNQFSKKCDGLPLALVVIGGTLSTKNLNNSTWKGLLHNIDWYTDGRGCMDVLSTSYDHLPAYLKPCFLYFASFPEDYVIYAGNLIRLWVAEGFISHDESKLMEDIAESYLDELVQRCMVQVSSRSIIGKIENCRIHDLLREVAIQKAKEDNFLRTFSKEDTHHLSGGSCARRVALNSCSDIRPLEHAPTNLRSLRYFGHLIPSFNRFRMLRVLDVLIDWAYYDDDYRVGGKGIPKYTLLFLNKKKTYGVKVLTALRYLQIPTNHGCMHFKLSSLAHLKNLQTVELWVDELNGELPESFWGNKHLRHVLFSGPYVVVGPPSSADLPNLLTLGGVFSRQEWGAKLPNFPHIRTIHFLMDAKGDIDWDSIFVLLSNLEYMGDLYLSGPSNWDGQAVNLTIPRCTSALKSHENLYWLTLEYGLWPKQTVDCSSMFPPHLTTLLLWDFHFQEDPMIHLEKLPNLNFLTMDGYWEFTDGNQNKRMVCSSGGFGQLQDLRLHVPLDEWIVEKDAMPQLNNLEMMFWSQLQITPALQYLTNLRSLKIDRHGERHVHGDNQWKIEHIPSVMVTSSWEI